MTRDLLVLMDTVEIGRMIRDARGRVRFAYDPRYPAAATPLSLSMPPGTYALHDAGAWLEGLVPDNDQILQSWAERMRARSSEAFYILSVDRVAGLAAGLPEAFATAAARITDDNQTRIANDLTEAIVAHVEHQRKRLERDLG